MIKELTEAEFKSTFTNKMLDVTSTAEPILDIWEYVEELVKNKAISNDVFENGIVELVYRNDSNTFDQLLLPIRKNVYLVIIIDLLKTKIHGHHLLNLNKEYGLK